MSLTKKRLAVVAAGAVALAVCAWLFANAEARRSTFCSTCHYMQPYVEEWKASAHKNVECIKCHPAQSTAMFAQFVKYITHTYNPRPRAFVSDKACLGCHKGIAKSKAVKFMAVSFPHQPHLTADRRGIRLRCASCHGSSQRAGHVTVDENVCFLCHFKGEGPAETVAGCGACHGAPAGMARHGEFIFDMKAYADAGVACGRCHIEVHEGNGAVSQEKCYSCHVSRVDRITDTKLVHDRHVEQREIRCMECHDPIRHGNIKALSVLDVSCESCHSNLHFGPKEMYLGVGAKGAPDTPSRMFAAQINCIGCHTKVVTQGGAAFLGQGNKTADPRACAACHDARYIPMVDRWKSEGKALVAEASRLARLGSSLAAESRGSADARKIARDLDFNARFLEQGHPVHNIEYAIKVVQASEKMAAKLSVLAGRKAPSPLEPAFARDAFSFCAESCHSFIPKSDPHNFQGVDFPHDFHALQVGLSCDTCHEKGKHKVLALNNPGDCASCHHDSAKADCLRCHQRQAEFYYGKIPASIGITTPPNVMAQAVGCADCHYPTNADAMKDIGGACEACHSGTGKKQYEDWTAQLKAGLDRVHLQADEVRAGLASLRRHQVDASALEKRFAEIQRRIGFIEQAKGIHNVPAALKEFSRAQQELGALLLKMGDLTDNKAP